ncbi:CatB-related O-acetyltransferase [Aliiglaciecola lipolytica]|nr:CatB-related O-acetyltransferase [Aliiglaciecola lipolytica]
MFELSKAGARDIDNNARFKKSTIDSQCCIDSRTTIDNDCHILENTLLNNCSISKYSYIGRNSIVQNSSIGAYCSIANDVCIGLGMHPKANFSTSPLFYRTKNTFNLKLIERDLAFDEYLPISIGNDVWIGARAIIMDGVNIGHGAIVAANAVVTKDVPSYGIVAGVPAKLISYRFEKDKIQRLMKLKWWDLPIENILEAIDKGDDFDIN